MTPERYLELEQSGGPLTKDEFDQGYHFCPDWDYALLGPDDIELEGCHCKKPSKWFTTDKPLPDGWYWMIDPEALYIPPVIVHVFEGKWSDCIYITDREYDDFTGWKWQGPIEPEI